MHEVEAKGILSSKNGMNIYRGCTHGCIYCDSRSTCYQMNHAFEDIEVKVNAPLLLEAALKKKRKKCMIGTGAMSDPYLHLEEKLRLTRQCITLIRDYEFGLAIQTKSARILQDIDILEAIHKQSKCVVQVTLTTYDEELCKKIEPKVSTTRERVEILKECQKRKIPTVVWFDPILPFINDTKENMMGILEYCREADVYGILCFGMGLTLRDGNRQYFYKKLDESFPGLKDKYIRRYGLQYEVNSEHNKKLYEEFLQYCKTYQMVSGIKEIFSYLHTYEEKTRQMSLFDFLE